MVVELAALLPALLSAAGIGCTAAGGVATRRFARRRRPAAAADRPITVLKPLCGPEPELEAALASFCQQDHPAFQIVFGVQDPADPAIAVVRRLQARFPRLDMTLVVDATPHGMNRKVANLINMLPRARHEVLVLADSDLHVPPDYLRQVQTALAQPGVGLVTTVYVGLPVVPGLPGRLAASHLSHSFLPGALLSRELGRQDCLGSTMALRRATLAQVGGFAALSPHLADDNVLGQLIQALGLSVALADTVPTTGVQERTVRQLWSHELRWARTIGALEPVAYAASSLQYPIAWALLAWLLSGFAWPFLLLVALAWAARAAVAAWLDRLLRGPAGRRLGSPAWLLPLRDVLSLTEIAMSYRARDVVWRGHAMLADPGRLPAAIRARSAAMALVGVLVGWPAAAQAPTAAQQQAIKQSCRADFESQCAGVAPGTAALSCLREHAPLLSGPCQAALAPLAAPAPQHAPPALSPRQELGLLRAECGADYRAYCRGVRPGGGAAIGCLRDNTERLSPACRGALQSARR